MLFSLFAQIFSESPVREKGERAKLAGAGSKRWAWALSHCAFCVGNLPIGWLRHSLSLSTLHYSSIPFSRSNPRATHFSLSLCVCVCGGDRFIRSVFLSKKTKNRKLPAERAAEREKEAIDRDKNRRNKRNEWLSPIEYKSGWLAHWCVGGVRWCYNIFGLFYI